MKIEINKKVQVDAKILEVKAGVRYWEDAKVNGVEDAEGTLVPCRNGEYWEPIIVIDTGKIKNWKEGTKASIHYKVCDDGSYFLKDENGEVVASIEDDYVPNIMCPEDSGYGDYIIMEVNEQGFIANWRPDQLHSFIHKDD